MMQSSAMSAWLLLPRVPMFLDQACGQKPSSKPASSVPALFLLPIQDIQDVPTSRQRGVSKPVSNLQTVRPAAHQRLRPPQQLQQSILRLLRYRQLQHANDVCGKWRQSLYLCAVDVGTYTKWAWPNFFFAILNAGRHAGR